MNRRHFLGYSTASLLAGSLGCSTLLASAPAHAANPTGWRMPDEGEPHAATWLAFAASEAIWGRKLLAGARDSQARIAEAIAGYYGGNALEVPTCHQLRVEKRNLIYELLGIDVPGVDVGSDWLTQILAALGLGIYGLLQTVVK